MVSYLFGHCHSGCYIVDIKQIQFSDITSGLYFGIIGLNSVPCRLIFWESYWVWMFFYQKCFCYFSQKPVSSKFYVISCLQVYIQHSIGLSQWSDSLRTVAVARYNTITVILGFTWRQRCVLLFLCVCMLVCVCVFFMSLCDCREYATDRSRIHEVSSYNSQLQMSISNCTSLEWLIR
jgi:hypothetical protein